MTRPMIGPFRGRHRIYSNFYPSPIRIEGDRYPTLREIFAGRTIEAADHRPR